MKIVDFSKRLEGQEGNTLVPVTSYRGSISASGYSCDDNTFLDTFTGNNTVTMKTVEDLNTKAETFKNCLNIYTYIILQLGYHEEIESTARYARNTGLIESIDHVFCIKTEFIRATVDRVLYR